MSSSSMWTSSKQKCSTALGCASLVIACVFIMLPRQNDFLELYREVVRFVEEDVLSMSGGGVKAPAYTKDLKLTDLKHMLAAGSPSVRASAVQALGDRREEEVLAPLVQLLNDTELVNFGGEQRSISELSKDSLTRFIRTRITQEPGNIRILIPYLSGTLQGTPLQRASMIDILGDIKEPLSRTILTRIAHNEHDAQVRNAAQRALKKVDSRAIDSSAYPVLRANQRRLVIVMVSLACVLVLFMVYRFRKDEDRRLALLSLLPALVCGGFGILITMEYSRGVVDSGIVDKALRDGNRMVIRTGNYHDQTDFPGDSCLARDLVREGDSSQLSAFGASSLVEPDDLDALKRMVDARRDWIWSRILVSKLGGSALQDLARNGDSRIRLAMTTALDKLMITNDEIIAALELLEKDEDRQVSEKAAEVLPRSRNYLKWPPL
jgi:hypothetical protein